MEATPGQYGEMLGLSRRAMMGRELMYARCDGFIAALQLGGVDRRVEWSGVEWSQTADRQEMPTVYVY